MPFPPGGFVFACLCCWNTDPSNSLPAAPDRQWCGLSRGALQPEAPSLPLSPAHLETTLSTSPSRLGLLFLAENTAAASPRQRALPGGCQQGRGGGSALSEAQWSTFTRSLNAHLRYICGTADTRTGDETEHITFRALRLAESPFVFPTR
ncbi:hypothetical protein SKAU_G00228940 [Synaphobranchus kaupii]|uniref:Uncharacterized protein n=1 Tax=Synaphobranchus kaupii TaxID=118154 RepID=A0A9Q1F5E3_SYNKA|nr:hypothetical protein SKAU_G00228940 [Synaphobranchus kaupii]